MKPTDRRGSTGVGRPAPMPSGHYARMARTPATVPFVVQFVGEDGRQKSFDIGTLPLPGWHDALAQGWARRIGPAGTLRTLSSAMGGWAILSRFMHQLSSSIDPPLTPGDLRPRHVNAHRQSLEASSNRQTVAKHLHVMGVLLDLPPLSGQIDESLRAKFRPRTRNTRASAPGYSDSELRSIVAAARGDVAAIRTRLRMPPPVGDRVASNSVVYGSGGHVAVNVATVTV